MPSGLFCSPVQENMEAVAWLDSSWVILAAKGEEVQFYGSVSSQTDHPPNEQWLMYSLPREHTWIKLCGYTPFKCKGIERNAAKWSLINYSGVLFIFISGGFQLSESEILNIEA